MYRSRAQAEKDLRDLLNRHRQELDDLPPGGSVQWLEPLFESRGVYVVEPHEEYPDAASSVTTTERRHLYVKILKAKDGALHLRTMYLKGPNG